MITLPVNSELSSTDRLWIDEEDYKNNDIYTGLSDDIKILVDQFHEDGYCVIKNAFSKQVAEAAVDAVASWIEKNKVEFAEKRKSDGTSPRIVNVHEEVEEIKQLFLMPNILNIQDVLFGAKTCLYTSLYFNQGSQQPIHRDVPMFLTCPENYYFGTWFALEDATVENGCLIGYPGGHLINVDRLAFAEEHCNSYEDLMDKNFSLWQPYQNYVSNLCQKNGLKEMQLELKQGDVLIWHPLFPHGGGVIGDKTLTRHSVVFHVTPEGVPVYQQNYFFNVKAKLERRSNKSYKYISPSRIAMLNGPTKIASAY